MASSNQGFFWDLGSMVYGDDGWQFLEEDSYRIETLFKKQEHEEQLQLQQLLRQQEEEEEEEQEEEEPQGQDNKTMRKRENTITTKAWRGVADTLLIVLPAVAVEGGGVTGRKPCSQQFCFYCGCSAVQTEASAMQDRPRGGELVKGLVGVVSVYGLQDRARGSFLISSDYVKNLLKDSHGVLKSGDQDFVDRCG
uniref:Uncharacterized protein n=1 Tax=Leersia perrieri TaxID=77586 RepID=A0A0D9XBM9_9ORYZ